MIGHGLAHVSFAGVALGLFLNIMPLAMALAISILAALAIMKLKVTAGLYGDTAIGIFSSIGMALGIFLVTLARGFNVNLFSYLFGDILAIDPSEVWLSIGLAAVVVLIVIFNYHKFLYMTFDRDSAKASGIRVNSLDTVLTVLAAITVVLGMRVVGILLVAALLVIPAAAGLQVASNFKRAMMASSGVALVSVTLGLLLAFYFDFPASGTIVIISFLFFALLYTFKKKRLA